MLSERPVYAEVDLSAIRHNIQGVKNLLKPATRLCVVVKADGYGHGAAAVAREAVALGADYLAVAVLDEAIELRAAGFTQPLLVLGFTPPSLAHSVVYHNLTQTIYTVEQALALSTAAVAQGKTAVVHVKIDTGMGRLGVAPADAGMFCRTIRVMPKLRIEGAYTHFAMADSTDKAYANKQFAAFKEALAGIEREGTSIPIRHCANSAATIDLPEMHLDMVRTGIITYGLWPSDEVDKTRIHPRPAMCFKAGVAYVKQVPAGTAISYGCTHVTGGPATIATLPVGYADGWTRMLSGKAKVLIKGVKAPVVGRICMDQCMIDVTGIEGVAIGDEAVLFGTSELHADDVAAALGTINYEITCMVGKRVPRKYV